MERLRNGKDASIMTGFWEVRPGPSHHEHIYSFFCYHILYGPLYPFSFLSLYNNNLHVEASTRCEAAVHRWPGRKHQCIAHLPVLMTITLCLPQLRCYIQCYSREINCRGLKQLPRFGVATAFRDLPRVSHLFDHDLQLYRTCIIIIVTLSRQ